MPAAREAHSRKAPLWAVVSAAGIVVLAVTAWAYWPALDAGFVLDDTTSIIDNLAVHWQHLSWDAVKGVRSSSFLPRRLVANLSFGLNHLAGDLDPFGYHLTNIVIHLLVGLVLAWLIRVYLVVTDDSDDLGSSLWQCCAVVVPAALFLVHPLNTQAVTYVVQRMTSLAALFALLALALYVTGRSRTGRGRRWLWLTGAFLCWLVGLNTKENVLVLPIVLMTYEWCFHRSFWRATWHSAWSNRGRRPFLIVTGVLVAGTALVLLRVYAAGGRVSLFETFPDRDFNGVQRLLTQARVHWLYISQLVWPAPQRLNLDHSFPISRGLLQPPTTGLAVLGLLLLVGCSAYLAARRPRLGFPLIAYWEFHAIESGPLSLEMVFEHRMYLPMTMLALSLGVCLSRARGRQRMVAMGSSVVAFLVLAGATEARNRTWSDPVRLAEDIVAKSPDKPRPLSDLGLAYLRVGRLEEAEASLRQALELEPGRWKARLLLADVLLETGRGEEALAETREAIRLVPLNVRPAYAYGAALERLGRTEAAFEYYLGLGATLGMEGRAHQAIEPLRRAVAIEPGSSEAHNSLGNAYLMAGFEEEATQEYRTAVLADPENIEAVYNLATRLDRSGKPREALSYYRRFVELAPPHLADHARQAAERIQQIEEGRP